MKRRVYGSTKDIVTRAFDEIGGVKQAAFLLGLKPSQTFAYADPDDGAEISFDRIRLMVGQGATAPVEDLCTLAGGHFVPGGTSAALCPLEAATQAAREMGDVSEKAIAALAGSTGAPAQVALLREIDEAVRALARFRVALAKAVQP